MSDTKHNLPPRLVNEALAAVLAGQQNPGSDISCPVCSNPGLQVEDRSARPYAEWYVLSCKSCGLEDTIHIPMGSPPGRFS